MAKLSKRTVELLETKTSPYIVFDEQLPGFGVRMMPSGRRYFLVQYRRHGKTQRVMIGQFGPITAELGQHRSWAKRAVAATIRLPPETRFASQ